MPRNRPPWTRRQREQFKHLANYVEYPEEKVAGYVAARRPVPELLREAIRLLPGVKRRIEKNDFGSAGELWREVENRIVKWYIEASNQWKPRGGAPPPGSRPS